MIVARLTWRNGDQAEMTDQGQWQSSNTELKETLEKLFPSRKFDHPHFIRGVPAATKAAEFLDASIEVFHSREAPLPFGAVR